MKTQDRDVKKRRRAALSKMAILLAFTVLVWLFLTIAWFTMNREVGTSGMGVTTATMPFDIATRDGIAGSDIRYGDIITSLTDYSEGEASVINDIDYHKLGSNDKLLLRFSTGESEIGPDGCGALNLYVIPNVDDSFDVKVTLNVTSFAEIEKYEAVEESGVTSYVLSYKKNNQGGYVTDSSGNRIVDTKLVEIKSLADFQEKAQEVHNSNAATNAETYISAANYLKGHIMFFGGLGDTTAALDSDNYYYTTPYTTRQFTKTITANNKGNAIQIPIYWMWTNTLGQIALADNSSALMKGISLVSDDIPQGEDVNPEKADLAAYLSANKTFIFTNTSESGFDAALADPSDSDNFKLLSSGYNAADQLIGMNVAYFMIDVTVEPA